MIADPLAVGALLLALQTPTEAQDGRNCRELTVAEENYVAVTERVYLYVGNIDLTGPSGGWWPFSIWALAGQYRSPFLLAKGSLKQGDVQRLLAGRPDITQTILNVGGFTRGRGRSAASVFGQAKEIAGASPRMTFRMARIHPIFGGKNSVFLEVCNP